jgi:alpha-glucosidase (family GH31 glycosyl hydrolase)
MYVFREQGIGRGDEPVGDTCVNFFFASLSNSIHVFFFFKITSLLNSSNSVFGQFSGGDHFTTYCSVPQFVSTDNRCVFLENSEYASFDLREPDRIQIRLNASTLTGCIIQGTDLLDVISEYTLYSGRMDLLPDWVSNGAIVGMQGGQEKVRNVIQDLCRHNTPIAAVWLQDWCGKRLQKTPNGTEFKRLWWNWESDDVLYSDWSQLVHDLGSLDSPIRTLVYVNTFLSNVKSKPTFKENLFEIAQERGYLVKDPTSTHEYQTLIISSGANFEAGILDVTNAEARQWFQGIIKKRIWDAGISGMMTDFGEYLPYDSSRVSLSSGVPSEVYHNRYPEDWAKLHHELIHQLGKENEAVCFYRAGFTRTPGFINLMWAGDQNVSWDQHDGIQSAVTGMLSGGFSGFSVTHSDIGGYTTISAEPVLSMVRSKELLFRWCELSAFTSVFRTHEGIIPELNAQFYDDEETFAHYAFTARLYTSWSLYRKQLLMEAHTKGWPVMRHLVLYYPEDPIVRQITCSQYLLGQFLLVVPVLTSSVTQVRVYFPAEKDTHWRSIWTNDIYAADGTFAHVNAPIKRPAVFVKYPRQDNGLLDDLLRFACDQETQA